MDLDEYKIIEEIERTFSGNHWSPTEREKEIINEFYEILRRVKYHLIEQMDKHFDDMEKQWEI